MASKGNQAAHLQWSHVHCKAFTEWLNLWNLHAIDTLPDGQARLRVSRLFSEMPQALSRTNAAALSKANDPVNRIVQDIRHWYRYSKIVEHALRCWSWLMSTEPWWKATFYTLYTSLFYTLCVRFNNRIFFWYFILSERQLTASGSRGFQTIFYFLSSLVKLL